MTVYGPMTVAAIIILAVSTGLGQQNEENSADDIAREMSNPVGSLASLVLQGTWTQFGGSLAGASDRSASSLIFMPTLPFKLAGGNMVFRPSFPVANASKINSQGAWEDVRGFGDMVLVVNWGKMESSGIIWSLGGTFVFPTASDAALGDDQWQAGPAAILGFLQEWGVLGAFWQHWWGLNTPDEGAPKANTGTLQLFYWFSVNSGWQVGGSPIPTANYVSATDIDFTVPINLGVAKTFMLGSTPLKATVQGQYFVTRPDAIGSDWGIFFQIAPVVGVPW